MVVPVDLQPFLSSGSISCSGISCDNACNARAKVTTIINLHHFSPVVLGTVNFLQ